MADALPSHARTQSGALSLGFVARKLIQRRAVLHSIFPSNDEAIDRARLEKGLVEVGPRVGLPRTAFVGEMLEILFAKLDLVDDDDTITFFEFSQRCFRIAEADRL